MVSGARLTELQRGLPLCVQFYPASPPRRPGSCSQTLAPTCSWLFKTIHSWGTLLSRHSPNHTVTSAGAVFIWRDCCLWRRAARGDLLCIPDYARMQRTVFEELHATQLGRQFGRKRTLALARRSVWWPSLWLPLYGCVLCVSVSRLNMACPWDTMLLCPFQSSGATQSAWTSWHCQGHVQGWTFCRYTLISGLDG